MTDYAGLLVEIDGDIKAGRAQIAMPKLSALNSAQMPRQFRRPFANAARRIGMWSLGLRFLAPVVNPTKSKKAVDAKPDEIAEYAVLLYKNGSIDEALARLASITAKEVPQAPMFRAFCHMGQWDPERAIAELRSYLSTSEDPYMSFVAQVNLSACLIWNAQLDEVVTLLDELVATAKEKSYTRLLGNCFELRGQARYLQGKLAHCESDLNEAARVFGPEDGPDQLLVRKWRAVLQGIEKRSIEPLLAFRQVALERQQWERVRETDLHGLKIRFDGPTMNHLVFGTPFAPYRARVEREVGRRVATDHFLFGAEGAPSLDLLTGEMSVEGSGPNPGKKIHKLLGVLLEDLYRPLPIGALFSRLFPGDYFDVFSSPNRIHQVLWRARQWIGEENLPLEIHESEGSYSLKITGDFAFVLRLEQKPIDGLAAEWNRLESAYLGDGEFRSVQAADRLGVSATQLRRLVKWGVENGKLERVGSGSQIRYRFATLRAA